MNILFVTPEVFPFARAGGLGDVSYYLPRALTDRGHRIWVITPKYRGSENAGYDLVDRHIALPIRMSWPEKTAEIYTVRAGAGIEVILVGCDDLYNRNGLYGNEFGDYEDNAERFIFFSRAVLETIKALDLHPDLVHCHDWPSGLVPLYAKTEYADLPNLAGTATVFTFHNLGSQGIFWHYDYAMTGLGWDHFTPEGVEFHGRLNMTKAGLVAADVITTVSRKYASEALTSEYAFGLEGVIAQRRGKVYAVLNGVDYTVWNPASDTDVAARYSADDLAGKARCREDLATVFELEPDDWPIVAVISRLLDRKGFDILYAAMDSLLSLPLRMVFMGRGEDRYQLLLGDLARAKPGQVGAMITYEKALAHRIMAGADIFLMPSRYEPCGLEQLYGLKYGTVPVVRATGGLDDTVIDVKLDPENGTGFKFLEYSPDALFDTLADAVEFYGDRPTWRRLMQRGMRQNFSWDRSAAEYEKIYELALAGVRVL